MVMIQHGKPVHNFFIIIQPTNHTRCKQLFGKPEKQKVVLNDPVSGEQLKAVAHDFWRFPLDEMPGMFSHLAYGKPPDDLKKILLSRYPELSIPGKKVEYWLLEKISE